MRTKKTKMRKTKIRKTKKIGGSFFKNLVAAVAKPFWSPEPIDISVLRMKIINYLGKYRHISDKTNNSRINFVNSSQTHRNAVHELHHRNQIAIGIKSSSPGLHASNYERAQYNMRAVNSQSRWNNAYTGEEKAKIESIHTRAVHLKTLKLNDFMDSLISLLNHYWSTHCGLEEESIFIEDNNEPIVDIDKLNEYFELYETPKKSHMQHELLQLNQVVLKIETLENEIALSKR